MGPGNIFRAFTLFAALAMTFNGTSARASEALSSEQKKAVEKLVEQYILDNPEVLIRAIDRLQAKRRAQEQAADAQTLKSRAAELRNDPETPFAGDREGDVVVVEFFDYRCGVCKRVLPIVLQLLEKDPKVKLVYKEWPILGPESVFASRAALASRKQGKYVAFHNEMMKAQGAFDETAVMMMARRVGIDTAKLRRDMDSPEIEAILKRNYALADALRLNGTPSFVVGDALIRGGRNYESMQALVDEARKQKKDGT